MNSDGPPAPLYTESLIHTAGQAAEPDRRALEVQRGEYDEQRPGSS